MMNLRKDRESRDELVSKEQLSTEPLIQVNRLTKHFILQQSFFSRQKQTLKAVDDVSFTVYPGETLGIVGESGSGKTTLAHLLMGLLRPTSGKVVFNGVQLTSLSKQQLRQYRKHMQMIFQDPFSSLNPRLTVYDIINEPLITHKSLSKEALTKEIHKLLRMVGLNKAYVDRYPHELSGGERQRVGIARAIALRPQLIICDEPISALDVSIQSQILNLLKQLQQTLNLTYIFIGHDLPAVKYISDRIAVMYLGRIVEQTDKETLFKRPLHPYTAGLIASIPIRHPAQRQKREVLLEGDPPSPVNPPKGCHFHTRCPYATEKCLVDDPNLEEKAEEHFVACHYPLFSSNE